MSPTRIRCLQARGRGRVKREREVDEARRRGTSHQTHALPDLRFLIAHGARAHGAAQSLVNSVSTARLSHVAHPPSPRYAARNFSIENTVPRDSMSWTARPILCARIESAWPWPCFFSSRARSVLPSVVCRRNSTAASEKAHFRWTLPILAPPIPSFLPADSWRHLIKRAYDANSWTRSKRVMS